jgi:thymidine kinase
MAFFSHPYVPDFMKLIHRCELFSLAADRTDYMREYMGNRYHSKRQEVIDLLGGKCSRCGAKSNLVVDHIDSKKKKMRSADVHSVSEKRLKQELPNLQVLCRKCHHEKSHEAWDFNAPKPRHGTYWMYRRHGCRCPKCEKAYKEKGKEWRREQRRKALRGLAGKD